MNGTARGALIVSTEGRWATKGSGEEVMYVCQQAAGNFCFDGMKKHKGRYRMFIKYCVFFPKILKYILEL